MARVLVMAAANRATDQHDICVVKHDEHVWGRAEKPPIYWCIDVINTRPEDIEHLTESQQDELVPFTVDGGRNLRHKHGHKVHVNKIPQHLLDKLEQGPVAMDFNQFMKIVGKKPQ